METDENAPSGGGDGAGTREQTAAPAGTTSNPVLMLVAFSEGRAGINDVVRSLISHRGWLVPLAFAAQGVEETRAVGSVEVLSAEARLPADELWIFTDQTTAHVAQAKGASLGAYAGGIAGTELFGKIGADVKTVRVNPGSPREHTWMFQDGGGIEVTKIWADAVALEEGFARWRETGTPDHAAVLSYRAFMTFDFSSSGRVVTLPNQGGMSNPAAAFTAPDCADTFLSELSEDQRAGLLRVTIGGRTLLENSPQLGIDGLLINIFGPGETYSFPFDNVPPR